MRWLRRWDIWSGAIGIFGVLFAIYAYAATVKVGRISYTLDYQKVFDPTGLSGFTLLNTKGDLVREPVYATDLVIWNSGDLSLSESSDRVREPLKVEVSGEIHYFIISKVNLVDKENFRISISPDKKSITVAWKFFDPSQGIRLTLLHSSNLAPVFSVTGRFFETYIGEAAQINVKRGDRGARIVFIAGFVALAISFLMFLIGRLAGNRLYETSRRMARQNKFLAILSVLYSQKAVYILAFIGLVEGVSIIGVGLYFSYLTLQPPV